MTHKHYFAPSGVPPSFVSFCSTMELTGSTRLSCVRDARVRRRKSCPVMKQNTREMKMRAGLACAQFPFFFVSTFSCAWPPPLPPNPIPFYFAVRGTPIPCSFTSIHLSFFPAPLLLNPHPRGGLAHLRVHTYTTRGLRPASWAETSTTPTLHPLYNVSQRLFPPSLLPRSSKSNRHFHPTRGQSFGLLTHTVLHECLAKKKKKKKVEAW